MLNCIILSQINKVIKLTDFRVRKIKVAFLRNFGRIFSVFDKNRLTLIQRVETMATIITCYTNRYFLEIKESYFDKSSQLY